MKSSTPLRFYFLDRQLISMYGPFRCYNKWEVRAWVAGIIALLIIIYGVTG